ncbi:MAG: molybdenum cofactor guanylyltransferase [Oscillospiraceae bacterium]|nr:molybdenum cofactor guanylyltransferase [Oscillospiraceae bacterium]
MKADGLILAGGKSSRMGGKYKGALPYGGTTFIGRLIEELKSDTQRLWLSYGEQLQGEYEGCRIIRDEYLDCGPMGGLQAGLKHCESELLLVAACDMPLLKMELYQYLFSFLGEHGGVVPVCEGRIHPLAALYKKKLLPIFESYLQNGNYRLRAALEESDIYYVDVTDYPDFRRMLQNINTEEDYAALLRAQECV